MKVLQINFGQHEIDWGDDYPDAIQYPDGWILYKDGIGKYPYDCIMKDKHPEAMIYTNGYVWSAVIIK